MDADRQKAMLRGTLVHRPCKRSPTSLRNERSDALIAYLARAAQDFSAAEHQQIAAQVNAVLGDSRFAELFSPGSRAEVPIVGRLRATDARSGCRARSTGSWSPEMPC